MAQTSSMLSDKLPRTAQLIGIPLAAFLLTTFFILIGFPYHHLTDRATALASRALGVDITAEESGLSPGLDGPGFRFDNVRVETPTADVYRVSTARFGPAWSLSWFTLTPTFFFEVESAIGSAAGRVTIDDAMAWSGTFTDVDLDELGALSAVLPVGLTGKLSAEGDVVNSAEGLVGPLTVSARGGVLSHDALPLQIPFETLDAVLDFGTVDDAGETLTVRIDRFALDSPLLKLNASGSVGRADNAMNGPVSIQIDLANVNPRVRRMIEPFGIRIGAQGDADIEVSGTVGAPRFQQ